MSVRSRPSASAAAKSDRPEPPSGRLAIVLSCPRCGAPLTVDDSAVTVTCEQCRSLLILSAPERDEIFLAVHNARAVVVARQKPGL